MSTHRGVFSRTTITRVASAFALVVATLGFGAIPANAAAAGGILHVTVALPGGAPATAGCVSVWQNTYTYIGDDCDQPSGSYSVPIAADGDYSIDFDFAGAPYQTYSATDYWNPDVTLISVTGGATVNVTEQLVARQWLIGGTLTDSGGIPVDHGVAYLANASGVLEHFYTDADGFYVLGGVALGDYYLGFSATDTGAPSEWYAGVLSLDDATAITVVDGSVIPIDYQLAPTSGTIAGTVTRSSGGAATGGCVNAYEAATGTLQASDCVDGTGAYAMVGVPIGSYKVEFAGFTGALNEWYNDMSSKSTATPIAVGGGATTQVNAVLAPLVPILSSLAPTYGSGAGGTVVVLTGSGLSGVTGVTFGGVAGTSVSIASSTELHVTTPAHAAGVVNVVATDTWGPSAPITFTFMVRPQVSVLSPSSGSSAGGTHVTLTGTGLTGLTGVTFNGVAGTGLSVASDTVATVTTPPGTNGAVNVVATNPIGSSDADTYTYNATPVISGRLPTTGPAAGGTHVTLTGHLFTGVTQVTFDGVPGTDLAVASDTSLVVTAPAHAAAVVDVVVTNGAGPSQAIAFTYRAPIVLSDISGNPFEADIQWMANQGISTGYADGTFRPAGNVSRQAMAAFMYRFAGSPAFTPPVTSPFNDVPTSSTFYTEICWMSDQAITTGYADGGFHPGANVSRQAMAAFMYRFAGRPAFTPPVTSPFNDVPTSSPFYTEIAWMSDATISTGYADGGFHPGANVSRQAMAAFMHRLDGALTPA